MSNNLDQIKKRATPILKEFGILQAGVFGSYARGEEKPGSDIDFLIRLGRPIDLVEFIRLKNQLQDSLGTSVDLVTDDTIIPQFEPYIHRDLVSIYE